MKKQQKSVFKKYKLKILEQFNAMIPAVRHSYCIIYDGKVLRAIQRI
jgi:hypothetical protein